MSSPGCSPKMPKMEHMETLLVGFDGGRPERKNPHLAMRVSGIRQVFLCLVAEPHRPRPVVRAQVVAVVIDGGAAGHGATVTGPTSPWQALQKVASATTGIPVGAPSGAMLFRNLRERHRARGRSYKSARTGRISRSSSLWYRPGSASRSVTRMFSSTLWMLALTGPTSMHSAPRGAMKRASEVPPAVLSSGGAPANSPSTARAVARRWPSGV